jgi:hypothetical protein
VLLVLALVLLVVVVLLAALAIHLLVLRDVYVDPSFSRSVSVGVIAFVLVTDVFAVGLSLMSNGPVLLKDFTNTNAIFKIFEKDTEKGNAIFKKVAEMHSKKPWLIRRFTRVKMPKRLPEV